MALFPHTRKLPPWGKRTTQDMGPLSRTQLSGFILGVSALREAGREASGLRTWETMRTVSA